MDCDHKELIVSQIEKLMHLIDLNAITPLLVNKRVFSQPMIDDLMTIEDETARIQCFLIDLTRRGPNAFDAFVDVLTITEQTAAVRILNRNSYAEENIYMPSHFRQNLSNPGGEPTEDVVGHTSATIGSNGLLLNVKKATKIMRASDEVFKMTANPRGFCLIINNVNYINNVCPQRDGSEAEATLLKEVFTQLHFQVEIETNLQHCDMKDTLYRYANSYDLIYHDAFVLIILSHGTDNAVIATDGIHIEFDDIIKYFNNNHCPLLMFKPRLCFFICCRGEKQDHGPKSLLDIDYKAVTDSKKIELKAATAVGDIFVCYSTVKGYVSWRNQDSGSWVGTSLAHVLMDHACDKELHEIMRKVSRMVNSKKTKYGAVQAIHFDYRDWDKAFYFNPGCTDNL